MALASDVTMESDGEGEHDQISTISKTNPAKTKWDLLSAMQPANRYRVLFSLDITSLISAADCCLAWREMITEKVFLDEFCKRRFNLSIDQLPPLLPCEQLLINSQRLEYQGLDGVFVEADQSLLKIYALMMRSVWSPFAFESFVLPHRNKEVCGVQGGEFKLMHLGYPWPYDIQCPGVAGKEKDLGIFLDIQLLSARFHAAFPDLHEMLLVSHANRMWAWGWKLLCYYTDITKSHFHRLWIDHHFPNFELNLATRKPRVIELQVEEENAMFLIFYDDDGTWRVANCRLSCDKRLLTREPTISAPISWTASFDDVRNIFGPVVQGYIGSFMFRRADPQGSSNYLKATEEKHTKFQSESTTMLQNCIITAVGQLEEQITTNSADATPKIIKFVDGYNFPKIIKFLDEYNSCATGDHPPATKCGKVIQSNSVGEALLGAVNRSVNGQFLTEVKQIYEDGLSYHIVQAWSPPPPRETTDLSNTDFTRMSPMEIATLMNAPRGNLPIMRGACNTNGQRQLWPSLVHKKAIDALPVIISKLETDLATLAL